MNMAGDAVDHGHRARARERRVGECGSGNDRCAEAEGEERVRSIGPREEHHHRYVQGEKDEPDPVHAPEVAGLEGRDLATEDQGESTRIAATLIRSLSVLGHGSPRGFMVDCSRRATAHPNTGRASTRRSVRAFARISEDPAGNDALACGSVQLPDVADRAVRAGDDEQRNGIDVVALVELTRLDARQPEAECARSDLRLEGLRRCRRGGRAR